MKVKKLDTLSTINMEVSIRLTKGALHLRDIQSGAMHAFISGLVLGNEDVVEYMALSLSNTTYYNIMIAVCQVQICM
jgi:hypothetical protein